MGTEIIARHNGFEGQVHLQQENFKERFYDLIDYALRNNNLKKNSEEILKKISLSKDKDFFTIIRDTYKLLECFESIIPEYNKYWLLYGIGDMFNKDSEHQETNSIRKRLNDIIDYTIKTKRNYHTYKNNWDGAIQESDFVEFIDILFVDCIGDRNFLVKSRFDKNFDLKQFESRLDKIEDLHEIGYHDIYWLVNKFQDLTASMNKLKDIIPTFNEVWLMFGEGDMFEKN